MVNRDEIVEDILGTIFCPENKCPVNGTLLCCNYCSLYEGCTASDKCSREVMDDCNVVSDYYKAAEALTPIPNTEDTYASTVAKYIPLSSEGIDKIVEDYVIPLIPGVLEDQPGFDQITWYGGRMEFHGIFFAGWNVHLFPKPALIPETSPEDFLSWLEAGNRRVLDMVQYNVNVSILKLYYFLRGIFVEHGICFTVNLQEGTCARQE